MKLAPLIANILLACCAATSAWGQFAPPKEYDYPYPGPTRIEEVATQDEIRNRVCSKFTYEPDLALGCTVMAMRICIIFKVSDAEIRRVGHDPAVFLRHEMAHCNGWPSHHPNARH